MNFVYLNGDFIPSEEAAISPGDQGLLLGHGIFETLRVEDAVPLAFQYHLERLAKSAQHLDINAPSEIALNAAVTDLIVKNKVKDARLRITLTGGDAAFPHRSNHSTLLISTAPLPEYPEAAKVITVPFTRNEKSALAGIKSLSYGENVAAQRYALARGADEAIFANTRGELCEGATTNIFVMIGGELCTPPLSSGCLPGTARRKVLAQRKISISEVDLPLPLPEIEFAFLTSSLRLIQPISEFDGKELPITHPTITQLKSLQLLD